MTPRLDRIEAIRPDPGGESRPALRLSHDVAQGAARRVDGFRDGADLASPPASGEAHK